jgi:EAL domain-containing protein (putative c-di-GMP-specific phosphodiesterase class I)
MYAAKANGKRAFHAYDPRLDAGRERRRQLESDLKAAIERNEIGLVYQPIVCARSHEVLCVEALARWKHPELGLIPPDQFIPIAESSGHIVELGRAILTSACREVRDWNVDLAVNLSPAQFWDRDLPRAVAEVLDATNFPAERLELEVTEGYLMRRPEAAGEILRSIASLGVRIALDDFGTGYASIGYLRELGFDSIKIDRSFVAASLLDERDANLARAIVSLGDALSLPVTAEGVETLGQAKLMQRAGCARLQGWLFGKPMPASEMGSWLLAQYRWVG